jgi:tellurium resistance protein TerD
MSDHFGIALVKGQNVQLKGTSGQFRKILIGCGWDPDQSKSISSFDLDVACAMLNGQRRMKDKSHFIYYGNLRSQDGAIIHTGDNLTGAGEGDDERIIIDLEKISQDVEIIPIVVCIYQAAQRKQNFGLISNSFIRIIDITNETDFSQQGPLFRTENQSTSDGMIFGELYRYQGEWKYKAIEKEIFGGFNQVLQSYI